MSVSIQDLTECIRNIPDFPKPGIQFKDITPVLASPKLFQGAIDHLTAPFQPGDIDVEHLKDCQHALRLGGKRYQEYLRDACGDLVER